jgi:CHAD domain-containing protein
MKTEAGYELCDYAATVVRERLERMLSHLDGVREATDIEAVHQMRVWSRRTRAALSVFRGCFPNKGFAAFEREVKRVTRALGAARDLDVMIDAQSKRLDALPEDQRAGLEAFLDDLRAERLKAQVALLAVADELERSDIAAQFEALAQKAKNPNRTPFFATAAYTLDLRLYEMQAFVPYLSSPDFVIEQHDMRIAAKHLRYTLEIFAEPFQEATDFAPTYDKALNQVKDIQEALGLLHDADVLVPRLAQFMAERLNAAYPADDEHAVGVHRTDFAGLAGLLQLCRTVALERTVAYNRLVKDWQKVEKDGLFDRLRRHFQQTIAEAEAAHRLAAKSPQAAIRQAENAPAPTDEQQAEPIPTVEGVKQTGSIEESEREQKGDGRQ